MNSPTLVTRRNRHSLPHVPFRTAFIIIHHIPSCASSLSWTRSPYAHSLEIHQTMHHPHRPSTPRRTNLSTRLTSRHRIRPIRIALPRNSSRRRHYRKLVRERHTRRQLDRLLPHRVACSVPRSRQAWSVRCVPAAQLCEAADDFDGFAVVGDALLGEGDGDFGGAG